LLEESLDLCLSPVKMQSKILDFILLGELHIVYVDRGCVFFGCRMWCGSISFYSPFFKSIFHCIVRTWLLLQCLLWLWGKYLKLISCWWGIWSSQFVYLMLKLSCFSWFSGAVSVIKTDRKIGQNMIFAAAESWGIPFVTQKSSRSGSLFLSDGQHVGSPIDCQMANMWVLQ
jgi:hypothetical protein